MKKFLIPQAKPNSTALHCEYLNIDGKMKPCDLDPHECVMGSRGIVSPDGMSFTPIEQPSIEATLRNCPKIKNVSLEWLSKSRHPLAKQFCELASRTPTKECVLCAMFFNDEGYSFNEIDEDEIEHFQQIADYGKLLIRIVSLKKLPEETLK